MKHSAYFFSSLVLLYLLSSIGYADELNKSNSATSVFHINQELTLKKPTLTANNDNAAFDAIVLNSKPQIQGKFSTSLVSIETGLMQSPQTSSWRKYYLNGAITLHNNNAFNLSLTANIEQFKDIDLHYYQMPALENMNTVSDSELNYSYGLIGSYTINSTWHFSGGIIHSPSINNFNSAIIHNNTNMALVGTTYTF
ncbi:MAG: hypothetical protein OQK09_03510 [Colwellia sp.]|nr:hypothetical protein [Colwellia sp.]MCW8864297.1 hypothetical protein [Colwellia sp.]MCW9080555.1 hypothetical protein [Colwellia sp.]